MAGSLDSEKFGQCMEDRRFAGAILAINQQILAIQIEMDWGRTRKRSEVGEREPFDS
jgi:hypothetical protein